MTRLPFFFLSMTLVAFPASTLADWPHARGPELDGHVSAPGTFESGHIGLDLAWRVPLGSGYSGIAVANRRAVTLFAEGDGDWVGAFDVATGKPLWRHRLDAIYKGYDGANDGPLSSPVIAGGSVYALSPRGHLISLDLDDGTLEWRKRLDADFGGRKPEYGFTTTPLVAGEVLIVQAGGDGGRAIVGLDARSGEKVWSHGDGEVSYQSPSLMTLAGRQQVVTVNAEGMSAFAADSGKVLWQRPFGEEDRAGSATATFVGDDRFLVPISGEAAVFRVSRNDDGFEVDELYRSNALGNSYAPPVYHDGHIYGYRRKILSCIRASDGERMWRSREPGGDGLILVDGHLVVFGGLGNVVVATASPVGYAEHARLQALDGSGLTWPSFSSGRIYVRNLSEMAAIAVTSETTRLPQDFVPGDLRFTRWLKKAEGAEEPGALVDELFASSGEMPIVEGEFVTFVYRGAADDVAIAGSMIENGSTQPLERLAGTDLFYRTYRLASGVRWEYRFQIDFDAWETDPHNPRTAPVVDGEGEVSELAMPGYEGAAVVDEAPAPGGRLDTFSLTSELLENDKEREVRVWLPPGYDDTDRAYPVLIVNDGDAWIDKALMVNTLEGLSGERMAPVIVAFVQPARVWWLDSGDSTIGAYVDMQVKELLPALRERYRLSTEAGAHGAMGNRFYATSALLASLRHPELFGKVGMQSAFTSGDQRRVIRELVDGESTASLRFYLDWNRYDERNVDRDWDLGRDSAVLAELLEGKGFTVTGGENLDSLGWGGWRARTDELLATLFPPR